VNGWVDVEASYTTVSRLRIDGSNTRYRGQPGASWCPTHVSQPLVIAGRNDILEHDDYFQSDPKLRGQGIAVGFWGTADDTIIRYDRIHDVGQCMAYDHLIYLASGNNVQIYGNWMWGDRHGRGVQVYPSPTNARVFWNVIDHVGEGFVVGDEVGATVSGNQIFSNVITNATGLPWEHIRGQAITDSYGGSPGAGNVFHDNVSYKNPGGIGHTTHVRMYRNTTADPHFIDAANHDYRVRPNSRLAHWPLLAGI
jgi:hypothetical protein